MQTIDSITLFIIALMGTAFICRYIPAIPEPARPLKTPFGKVLFFDGVLLYGAMVMVFLSLLKIMGRLLSWD